MSPISLKSVRPRQRHFLNAPSLLGGTIIRLCQLMWSAFNPSRLMIGHSAISLITATTRIGNLVPSMLRLNGGTF